MFTVQNTLAVSELILYSLFKIKRKKCLVPLLAVSCLSPNPHPPHDHSFSSFFLAHSLIPFTSCSPFPSWYKHVFSHCHTKNAQCYPHSSQCPFALFLLFFPSFISYFFLLFYEVSLASLPTLPSVHPPNSFPVHPNSTSNL